MVETVFYDAPEMVAIIDCESNFVHYQNDGTVLRGRVHQYDTGATQINLAVHADRLRQLGLDAEKLEDNLTFARLLYDEEGSTPWVCRNLVARN